MVPHKKSSKVWELTLNINKTIVEFLLRILIALSFWTKISWSIVLKAFLRSIKIIPVNQLLSNPFKILSAKKDKQRFVEWFALKPD